MQLGNGGTNGSVNSFAIINNGVLVLDRSDSITYGGVVSGTGSSVKEGSGTLTLTGTNTYTGGTTITAGTLDLGTGSAIGSIVGAVVNNKSVFNIVNANTAGITTITTDGGGMVLGATTSFLNSNTAGAATVNTTNAGVTVFSDSSTAGNATINNSNNGATDFDFISTAGNATINNNLGGIQNSWAQAQLPTQSSPLLVVGS